MNLFTKHPKSIGETYWQHFYFASFMGIQMVIGGIACFVHAICPFAFEKTASNVLIHLMSQFIERSKTLDPRLILLKEQIAKKQG